MMRTDDRKPSDRSSETLHAHLMWQLETEHFSPREFSIGEALIDAIDDAGYLTESLSSILDMLDPAAGYVLAEVEQTLTKVQALDPAGIGARDLGECLRLQLRAARSGRTRPRTRADDYAGRPGPGC